MPDGDVIRRGVRFAWRSAYEGLCSGGRDVDAAGLIAKSLAASLRPRGLPGLGDAAALVDDVRMNRVSIPEGLSRVAAAVGAVGGTRDATMLATAVRRELVTAASGARPDQAVAEAFAHTVVEADLMAKVRPALLERGDLEPAQVERIIRGWTEQAEEPIRRIAQQLVADPTGAALRSPPSHRRPRKNTAEMLNEPVV